MGKKSQMPTAPLTRKRGTLLKWCSSSRVKEPYRGEGKETVGQAEGDQREVWCAHSQKKNSEFVHIEIVNWKTKERWE